MDENKKAALSKNVFKASMFETLGTARRCCHAEIRLVVQGLRRVTSVRRTIEVGTSKLCCKLCATLLDVISQKSSLKIIIRGSHGKIYPSWALPDDIPTDIRDEFAFRVNRMVENLYHHLRGAQGDSTAGTPPEIVNGDWEQ